MKTLILAGFAVALAFVVSGAVFEALQPLAAIAASLGAH